MPISRIDRLRLCATAVAIGALPTAPAAAQPATNAVPANASPVATDVSDAALRFGIPEQWIYAVMRAESAGRVNATSPVGAMGLMQIMPATWATLRARYGLGNDAYDRRDNIMAGTAYLRELHDRYGAPGFLAAYNAGPGRYEDYLNKGRRLPAETRNYVARIAPSITGGAQIPAAPAAAHNIAPSLPQWTRAALFAPRSTGSAIDAATQAVPRVPDAPQQPFGGLFVALSSRSSQ